MGYDNLVVSIKSSDVLMCVKAHELIAKGMSLSASCRYYRIGNGLFGKYKIFDRSWDHPQRGDRKYDPGFFDRRSGRRDSKRKAYIKTLGLRKGGIEVVSCPTCGRTKIDLIGLANEVEKMVQDIPLDIKVAVMGCVVNPWERQEKLISESPEGSEKVF